MFCVHSDTVNLTILGTVYKWNQTVLSERNIYWNHVPKLLFRIFQGTRTKEAKDYVYVARWIFFLKKKM